MEPDHIFKRYAISQGKKGTMIACLYTGEGFPGFCAAMPRDPVPITGMILDEEFFVHVSGAIALNVSIHDGAIMIGRRSVHDEYRITGWSFRIFAPQPEEAAPVNRGSAFNSCFALSQTRGVDRVYLHSSGKMHRFISAVHEVIY